MDYWKIRCKLTKLNTVIKNKLKRRQRVQEATLPSLQKLFKAIFYIQLRLYNFIEITDTFFRMATFPTFDMIPIPLEHCTLPFQVLY